MVSSPATFAQGWSGRTVAGERARAPIAAWWLAVGCVGVFMTMFSQSFMPAKASLDSELVYRMLSSPDLWDGWSNDSYLNTARVWSLVLSVIPQSVAIPAYYAILVLVAVRLLDVFEVRQARYHLLAGGWVACSSLFLTFPNKEHIALPIALWLCLAGSRFARLLATVVFLTYAAFFRQYWVICFFYFVCAMFALRQHVARRTGLAVVVMAAALAVPFALAQAFDQEPLTEARMSMNIERVDSPDARSAFNNTFENTGVATDMANAAVAWAYMNVPVALLARTTPHYIFFAAFQLCTLWFFAAGCAAFLRDAKRLGRTGSVYLRCAAFVMAFSATQAIFEPDFGSFLRHEVVFMIPLLVVVFYRAHAGRVRESQPRGPIYGRHASADL